MSEKRVVLERSYPATLDDVWEMWTTPEGLESWWGPDGFHVEVRALDLREGGELRYAMVCDAPEQQAFMRQHGMPLVTEAKITYREVTPKTRLVYTHLADFIPGVAAYDVDTVVELEPRGANVHLRLSFDPMHDTVWTERATMGWQNELGKLAARLARLGNGER
jgi:uncharacterized protein YndB with AHSA1/START domain